MKTNNLKSLFIILIFIATQSTITNAQIYDTLYSYPDTTTFYNLTSIQVGDIVKFAVTFWPDSSWEYYQVEKLILTAPTNIDTNGYSYIFISLGEQPDDTILYSQQVFLRDIATFPNSYTIELEDPVIINRQSKFYITGGIFFVLSISQNLEYAVPGQFAYWFSLIQWIEYVPFYFNLKVVVKKNLTSIDETPSTPNEFYLEQNYPNPFNSGTSIKYHSPAPGNSEITIYNVLGQIVYQGQNSIGIGPNSFNISLSDQPTGVYFYRLTINNKFNSTKKMILLK